MAHKQRRCSCLQVMYFETGPLVPSSLQHTRRNRSQKLQTESENSKLQLTRCPRQSVPVRRPLKKGVEGQRARLRELSTNPTVEPPLCRAQRARWRWTLPLSRLTVVLHDPWCAHVIGSCFSFVVCVCALTNWYIIVPFCVKWKMVLYNGKCKGGLSFKWHM